MVFIPRYRWRKNLVVLHYGVSCNVGGYGKCLYIYNSNQ